MNENRKKYSREAICAYEKIVVDTNKKRKSRKEKTQPSTYTTFGIGVQRTEIASYTYEHDILLCDPMHMHTHTHTHTHTYTHYKRKKKSQN